MTRRGGVHPGSLVRYCRDLGWRDPLELPTDPGGDRRTPSDSADFESLESLSAAAGRCELCRLSETRSKVVFGEGQPPMSPYPECGPDPRPDGLGPCEQPCP